MPRRRAIEVSSDEEPSQSQPASQLSQTQGSSEISSENMRILASNVCNYLLVSDCKKIPAKRADIVKSVLKEHSRHFKEVMAEANQILERVYGYKVVELEKKNHFIMINTLITNNSDEDDLLLASTTSSEAANLGLVTAILAGIFMSGEVMQEGPMREYLKKLGVDIDSREDHPTFGNVTKYIHQDLVRQQYLQITLNKDVEPPSNEYRWGERAHKELSKRDILELVCKVYGNQTRPEDWVAQWKIVKREDEES
ncbi:non-structural maintenance of chromosomes element 3 homolog [Penaeus japonicus]|uniref:non-structural maintenance of chromosomes element 3 homolog n=1 Tax=Penaeus japonicus TaxID=27405 RepID=UPI001C7171CD|nr:non-structural maintenance of chromosomes element 3 homolog [Penaeus japonicus]